MHDTAARKVILGQGRDRSLGASHLNARDANDELAADSRCGDMQGAAGAAGLVHRTRICILEGQ